MEAICCAACSASPELLEPNGREFGIAHGVLNVAVSKVGLQGASVVPFVCQRIAASVPEHLRVRFEAQFGHYPLSAVLHHSKTGRAMSALCQKQTSSYAYSITSSARPNSFAGTVIPIAFDVLRLIDNIILVGNSTGSSPGGVPCRILSTK